METPGKLRHTLHHLIRALILGGLAFYVIQLVRTDHLTLYIAPRMTIYVKLAAMGLYVVAAVQLYEALRSWNGRGDGVSCECTHSSSGGSLWRSAGMYALFVLPLLTAFVTPDTTIGSSMAGQKGINLSASSSIKQDNKKVSAKSPAPGDPAAPAPTGLDALFPADQFSEAYANYGKKMYMQNEIVVTEKSYMEILTTLDMFLDRFAGKKLTISGFVYRDETTGKDRFILGRFAVQCCTADALPYGVMVEGAGNAQYAKDTWLTVTGTLGRTTFNDREIMSLQLEKAVPIKPAEDPYVYPDLDFGLN